MEGKRVRCGGGGEVGEDYILPVGVKRKGVGCRNAWSPKISTRPCARSRPCLPLSLIPK